MKAVRIIGRAPMQTVRAQALEEAYARPRKALADLEQRGVVHKLAYGYYCLVPANMNPDTWLPELETAGAGIGAAIWGDGVAVLMGHSAARVHGALPRATGEAVVAAPTGHRLIPLADRHATIRFVTRDVEVLEAVRVRTELGRALATTPAQTALDLARDPKVADQPERIAVIKALLAQTSLEEVVEVADTQGRTKSALERVQKLAAS